MRVAWSVAVLSLVANAAFAQVTPAPPELREVEVHQADAGFVAAPAVGLDGGTPTEVVPPALLQPSPAVYPPSLVEQRAGGVVRLELLIDEAGAVAEVRVDRGA